MRIVFDRVLDDLGRISIPKEIRRALGWRADDTIQLCADDDCVKIGKRIETNDDNDFHARWIPVSESLPESIINKVLVYCKCGYVGFGHYEKYKGNAIWYNLETQKEFTAWDFDDYEVTHWMPLPTKPKGE